MNVRCEGYTDGYIGKTNTIGSATMYKLSVFNDLRKIKQLKEKGYEVKWNHNECFCIINGETFNIHKSIYDKRINGEDLDKPFNDHGWSDRLFHPIEVF